MLLMLQTPILNSTKFLHGCICTQSTSNSECTGRNAAGSFLCSCPCAEVRFSERPLAEKRVYRRLRDEQDELRRSLVPDHLLERREGPHTLVCLDSQVAGNHRPLYPEVDHNWFKVAHNYEPLALQVAADCAIGVQTRAACELKATDTLLARPSILMGSSSGTPVKQVLVQVLLALRQESRQSMRTDGAPNCSTNFDKLVSRKQSSKRERKPQTPQNQGRIVQQEKQWKERSKPPKQTGDRGKGRTSGIMKPNRSSPKLGRATAMICSGSCYG